VARGLRIASVALITAGAVVLADVALTLAWREPISSAYSSIQQHRAADELADLERRFPGRPALRSVSDARGVPRKVRELSELLAKRVHPGEAIGRIVIPRIDLDLVAVQGTGTADLEKGPGHYPETPLPGGGGTSAFAGHRTTYLAPFRHLDALQRGDLIELEMPYASFDYRVERSRIVEPTKLGIVRDVGHERLVLTACHPLYSAAQRIAVFASLRGISFFAPGTRSWEDP
jgi:sortase A